MKKILLAVLAAVAMTSCGMLTPQTTESLIYRESSGRNIEPTQNAVIVPMVADLELVSDSKIEYVETFEGGISRDMIAGIESYKRIALLNASKKYNADTMVAALINIDTNEAGNLVITVTGFPARYVRFRTMTQDDQWLLNVSDNQVKSKEIVQ